MASAHTLRTLWEGHAILGAIWNWLKAVLGLEKQGRGESVFARLFPGSGSLGLPSGWSQDRNQQVQCYRHWTYIAVRAIAEEIAGHPPRVAFRRTPAEVERKHLQGKVLSRSARRKAMGRFQPHEELEPADSNHPLCELFANPNGPDTSETFWQRSVIYGELTGNIYWWLIPNGLGLPAEMWVLPSNWVWPSPDRQPDSLIDYYDIRPWGVSASGSLKLPADEVIHIPYPGAITPFDGWGPTTAGSEWIDVAREMNTARLSSFREGIWPGLILELDKEMTDPDETTVNRLYARLEQRFKGSFKRDRPMVMSPGMKVSQATRSPEEMDYTNGSDQMRDWVLALHRVSKTIAGITEEVNRASMEAASAVFGRWTIRPKLRLVDGFATEKLAKRYDSKLVVYHEDPVGADPELRHQQLMDAHERGILTTNEIREEMGYDPFPHGGDDPILPMTSTVMPFNTGEDGMGVSPAVFGEDPNQQGEGKENGNGKGRLTDWWQANGRAR